MKKLVLSLIFLCFFTTNICALNALQVSETVSGYMYTDGTPLANGTVTFYENDASSTTKDIYLDANKNAIAPQPISLNDSGQPYSGSNPIALFADGNYWVQLKDSVGNVVNTYQGFSYTSQVDFGGLYIDIASTYGRDNAALDAALTDYTGTGDVTFLFNSGEFINTDTRTFPSNIKMWFTNGAYLNNSGDLTCSANQIWLDPHCYIRNDTATDLLIAGDIFFEEGAYISNLGTATINGSIKAASNAFVLQGNGNYGLTMPFIEVYPDWFGADATGISDSATKTQKTINSITRGDLRFNSGIYNLGDRGSGYALLINKNSIRLIGSGDGSRSPTDNITTLRYISSTGNLLEIGDGIDTVSGITIKDLAMVGISNAQNSPTRTDTAIFANLVNQKLVMKNISIHNFGFGMQIGNLSVANEIYNNIIAGCYTGAYIRNNANSVSFRENIVRENNRGVLIESAINIRILDNYILNNLSHALIIGGGMKSPIIENNVFSASNPTDDALVIVDDSLLATNNLAILFEGNSFLGNSTRNFGLELQNYTDSLSIKNYFFGFVSANIRATGDTYVTLEDYHRDGTENVGTGTRYDIKERIDANATELDDLQIFVYEDTLITDETATFNFVIENQDLIYCQIIVGARFEADNRLSAKKYQAISVVSGNVLTGNSFGIIDETGGYSDYISTSIAAKGSDNVIQYLIKNETPGLGTDYDMEAIFEFRFLATTVVTEE